jgi:hypothetical protein
MMSTSPYNERNRVASGAAEHLQAGEVSRRTMLKGTVATTAVAAAGPISSSVYAQGADPNSPKDMMAFLLLSAALTGVHVAILAPEFAQDPTKPDILDADPGVDPIQVKDEYFKFINAADPPNFAKLLQIAKDHRQSAADIIAGANAADDTKFLARSIVLLWYLGSWYKPEDLKKNATPGTQALILSEVLSAKAYTQGLVWQIAQAHPMGYSNLQFGYWGREPDDPNDPTARSNLGFITPTIP